MVSEVQSVGESILDLGEERIMVGRVWCHRAAHLAPGGEKEAAGTGESVCPGGTPPR